MTFSEQMVFAMFKPAKYKEILGLKKRRTVIFIIVICMILSIVNFVIPTSAFIAGFGGFEKLFSQRIGEIHYDAQTGELESKRGFEISYDNAHFLINTEDDLVSKEHMKKNGIYISFGKKAVSMTMVNDSVKETYRTLNYQTVLTGDLNNDSLCDLIPVIYIYLVLSFVFITAGFFLKYGFFALILSWLINGANKRLEIGLSFGERFAICFYGQTFGMILSNFNVALGLLPTGLVSIVAVFISINMISSALVYIKAGDKI